MLNIKNLVCGYSSGFTLKDINLELKKGEFWGIVGPNGSGKTTLLKTITKLLKPEQGEIVLDGEDIEDMGFKDIAKKVAVVPQFVNTEVGISVEEFVFLGRIPHRRAFQFFETKADEGIAEEAMKSTGVFQLRQRDMNNLSGGEDQRVAVARALAQQPLLLLLDEPTAHLDIGHQVRILDLLAGLNEKTSLTIMAVFHDLNLASEYCDKLLLLKDGSVHSVGSPEKVLTYRALEEVYGTLVIVNKNPISGRPYVILVSHPGKYGKLKK